MSAAPDYIVTTGDFIAEWMEREDISAAELLRRLGVSRKHMSELLSGKAPLSQAVALKLDPVTGIRLVSGTVTRRLPRGPGPPRGR